MKRLVASLVMILALADVPASSQSLTIDAVNEATLDTNSAKDHALVVRAQVLLDRQRYSPGVIDGLWGESTRIALTAYQADNGLEPTGKLDEASFAKLIADDKPVLTFYEITAEDVKGPFLPSVPKDIAGMAETEKMAFTGPPELLSEKFHMTEQLLAKLNPGADFETTGSRIVVAAVESEERERSEADRIEIDKSEGTLRVLAKDGSLLALYPATVGSKANPAPDGEAKITRIAKEPTWTYDPELELEGHKDRPDHKVTVPAGPNNPVGTVWIALDRDHYGIHGTAHPEEVGKNVSSGCVRLTNWDAEELAAYARDGMIVSFLE